MTWLDQLELELDQRLAAFLRSNPVQEQLFRDQHQRDRHTGTDASAATTQRGAEEQRRQFLALAAEVKDWNDRIERARRAGAMTWRQSRSTSIWT